MTLENLKRLEKHFRSLGREKEADFYKARAERREKRKGLKPEVNPHGKKSA